jgi:hypothetical protein
MARPLSFGAVHPTSVLKLCIYPFVIEAVILTFQEVEVLWRRETFSLLSVSILLAACSGGQPAKPDLPASVSPGWTLSSYVPAARPDEIPADGSPQCWKAEYGGQGSAQVWVCGYKASTGAFDAVQRARAEAQTVKFQQGAYLVLVKWNATPKANLTALVRAVQKAMAGK